MNFDMRAKLLGSCKRFGALRMFATIWLGTRRRVCRADVVAELVVFKEGSSTRWLCALCCTLDIKHGYLNSRTHLERTFSLVQFTMHP